MLWLLARKPQAALIRAAQEAAKPQIRRPASERP